MSDSCGADFQQRIGRLEQLIHRVDAADEKIPPGDVLEIVRSLLELHGTGLRRMVELLEAGEPGAVLMRRLADDELIAGLLLLYDLHPDDDETRIRRALDGVRPYLRSHGGDVELIGIDNGTARLRLSGTCQGCPSSALTFKSAVEDAVYRAAPAINAVVADGLQQRPGVAVAMTGKERQSEPPAAFHWEMMPQIVLADGAVHALDMGGRSVLLCRLGETYYAYGSICPACKERLQGSHLKNQRLICSNCLRQYDPARAGQNSDDPELQLEPFPLLLGHGRARVALPEIHR